MTADKPESQEICFVPGGDYRDALRTRAGWEPEPGPLVDADGDAGRGARRSRRVHGGAAAGPRRRARRAALRVAHRPAARTRSSSAAARTSRRHDRRSSARRSSAGEPPAGRRSGPRSASGTGRRRPGDGPAELGDQRWPVTTDDPVWAAAPGQAAVLYDGDEVLGGGRIAAPDAAEGPWDPRAGGGASR